jgi:hypothetical protein
MSFEITPLSVVILVVGAIESVKLSWLLWVFLAGEEEGSDVRKDAGDRGASDQALS